MEPLGLDHPYIEVLSSHQQVNEGYLSRRTAVIRRCLVVQTRGFLLELDTTVESSVRCGLRCFRVPQLKGDIFLVRLKPPRH